MVVLVVVVVVVVVVVFFFSCILPTNMPYLTFLYGRTQLSRPSTLCSPINGRGVTL